MLIDFRNNYSAQYLWFYQHLCNNRRVYGQHYGIFGRWLNTLIFKKSIVSLLTCACILTLQLHNRYGWKFIVKIAYKLQSDIHFKELFLFQKIWESHRICKKNTNEYDNKLFYKLEILYKNRFFNFRDYIIICFVLGHASNKYEYDCVSIICIGNNKVSMENK